MVAGSGEDLRKRHRAERDHHQLHELRAAERAAAAGLSRRTPAPVFGRGFAHARAPHLQDGRGRQSHSRTADQPVPGRGSLHLLGRQQLFELGGRCRRDQPGRQPDGPPLYDFRSGHGPGDGRGQGRFLQHRRFRLRRGQLEGAAEPDVEPGCPLRSAIDSAAHEAQQRDAADHAVHLDDQYRQEQLRAAHRRRVGGRQGNGGSRGIWHLLREDHQQHLLRHPRGERRDPADVQLRAHHLPHPEVPQPDLYAAGRDADRSFRRRPDAGGGDRSLRPH